MNEMTNTNGVKWYKVVFDDEDKKKIMDAYNEGIEYPPDIFEKVFKDIIPDVGKKTAVYEIKEYIRKQLPPTPLYTGGKGARRKTSKRKTSKRKTTLKKRK